MAANLKRPCRKCGKKTRKADTLIQLKPGDQILRACLCQTCANAAQKIMQENQRLKKEPRAHAERYEN